MCRCASIVQRGEDARRALLLYQITDHFVVEIFDGGPFDLFSHIFFLFRLQSQLNEDLLQLFVDVVDAKLFKGVVLEYFETEDILRKFLSKATVSRICTTHKNTDELRDGGTRLHRNVDP